MIDDTINNTRTKPSYRATQTRVQGSSNLRTGETATTND